MVDPKAQTADTGGLELKSRAELKREYKNHPPPMGIFQITNIQNGKIFIDSSLNLPGVINRYKFQLRFLGQPNKELQADWDTYGEDAFEFEIIDELDPDTVSSKDYARELLTLKEMWLEKLSPFGEQGYNKQKKP